MTGVYGHRSPKQYSDQEILKVFSLSIKIRSYRNKWLHYLIKVEEYRVTKQAWQYHLQGDRIPG